MLSVIHALLTRVRKRPGWHYAALAFLGVGLGATGFSLTQHVSWFMGWYWAVVTATTVGYGDITPHNLSGRLIAMGTMLIVIPLLAAMLAEWSSSLATLRVRRLFGMPDIAAKNHWLILGFNSLIPHLMPELLARYPRVVLVANNIDRTHLPDDPSMDLLAGDPTNPHVLAKAQLDKARQVLIVGSTDGEVLMTAIEAHRLAPHNRMLAVTERANAVRALRDLGIDAVDTQSWFSTFVMNRMDNGVSPDTP